MIGTEEPWARSADDVLAAWSVDPSVGLDGAEVAARGAEAGPNELSATRPPSLASTIVKAMREPFIILLFVSGVLAALLGEVRDGLLILAGLVPIVGADVATSYRAERALASLRAASAPLARVRRAGVVGEVPAAELVPGDVVLIRSGELVPADLRLTSADALLVDRSALTGESIPEMATVEADPSDAVLADRRSMAFFGTAVVGGRGEGIVVAIGGSTEVGKIASTLADVERRRSPLQRELDRLVRIMLVVATALIVITSAATFLRGGTLGAIVLAGVSAAIAAIPEEPPVLLAVVLGLGAYRLLRRGVLVRRLSAEETLGAVDLIITDKTGTLTENRVELSDLVTLDGPVVDRSRREALLLHALRAEDDAWHVVTGSPPGSFTQALMAALANDHAATPVLDPSDLASSEGPADGHPYSVTWSRWDGRLQGVALGAAEAVLTLPTDGPVAVDAWHELVAKEAATGGRLLLLATADRPDAWHPAAVLVFNDRLRDGVAHALATATAAGIQTIVVTGDHAVTAAATARAVGLAVDHVLDGTQMASLDDAEIGRRLPTLSVIARAVPEDKLRLVDIARKLGRTVAVTGDGVNDAPALHHADVAVAMGSGTAVARGASDLVLGDDSFVTLMFGLREGRRIVANVQKGLVFLVSTHVALLGFILVATLAGFSQPLLPLQILWLELFIDLSASVAFEREPEEPDAMTQPPRPRGRPLLHRGILAGVSLAGGFSAVAALWLMLNLDGDPDHVRWIAYTSLVMAQLVRAYADRSLTHPVTTLSPNGLLAVACVLIALIQVAIPYVPPLAVAFHATPLALAEWAIVAAIAFIPALAAEVIRRTTGRAWVA